jgi:uncharacterized RDD family membrane protein YckC
LPTVRTSLSARGPDKDWRCAVLAVCPSSLIEQVTSATLPVSITNPPSANLLGDEMSGEPQDDPSQPSEPSGLEPDEYARTRGAAERDRAKDTPGDLGPRVGARVIDVLLLSVPSIALVYGLNIGPGWLAPQFLLTFVYFVLLDTYVGTTVGKRLLHLRVIGPEGDRPRLGQAARREAFTLLDVIRVPYIGSPSLIAMIVILVTISNSPTKQGWHDRFAGGTRVIKT